jgi:RHS repeat-associated protein
VWDPNNTTAQLALERDGSSALIRRYTYGTMLESMTTTGGEFYYTHDNLGTIAAVTSASGTAMWTYTYEPFGASRSSIKVDPTAPDNPMLFTGQYLDTTGLYHLRARQYDPGLGRFTTQDPLSTPIGDPYVASYVYAQDRASTLADPNGQWPSLHSIKKWASFVPVVGTAIAAYDYGASLANVALTCGIRNWGSSQCTDAVVGSTLKGVSLAVSVVADTCFVASALDGFTTSPACIALHVTAASLVTGVSGFVLDPDPVGAPGYPGRGPTVPHSKGGK